MWEIMAKSIEIANSIKNLGVKVDQNRQSAGLGLWTDVNFSAVTSHNGTAMATGADNRRFITLNNGLFASLPNIYFTETGTTVNFTARGETLGKTISAAIVLSTGGSYQQGSGGVTMSILSSTDVVLASVNVATGAAIVGNHTFTLSREVAKDEPLKLRFARTLTSGTFSYSNILVTMTSNCAKGHIVQNVGKNGLVKFGKVYLKTSGEGVARMHFLDRTGTIIQYDLTDESLITVPDQFMHSTFGLRVELERTNISQNPIMYLWGVEFVAST
ncbi:MAG: hypothetical protein K0S71_555 [Clostridia bacterium]|jgi:hypothetical protein|nr:hypothetical protein [Clostridia bacterium]